MIILAFLFLYSVVGTGLLTFLFKRNQYLQLQLKQLPKTFIVEFQVKQFFLRIGKPLTNIYSLLDTLYSHYGRPPVDYHFQFRFLLWWKFFGSQVLGEALETLNESINLKTILRCPPIHYTAEVLKSFMKKLTEDVFSQIQMFLLEEIETKIPIDYSELAIDSFPVKSLLNTQMCLQHVTLPEDSLKILLDHLDLSLVLQLLGTSQKKSRKTLTKLKVFIIKQILDIQDWAEVVKLLYDKKSKKGKFSNFYYYVSLQPFQGFEEKLQTYPRAKTIELAVVTAMTTALQFLPEYDAKHVYKTYTDLQKIFHIPHRWRDKGTALFYCAAKNIYCYGRGAFIIVINGLELPLYVSLTDKYKQSELSIQQFLTKISVNFVTKLTHSKLFGDAEFGIKSILSQLSEQLHWNYAIPSYSNSHNTYKLTKEERDKRKTVEHVIARLQVLWRIENPRLVGKWYAEQHVQLACLCDYFQVLFNLKSGNIEHIHQYKVIKRKI